MVKSLFCPTEALLGLTVLQILEILKFHKLISRIKKKTVTLQLNGVVRFTRVVYQDHHWTLLPGMEITHHGNMILEISLL